VLLDDRVYGACPFTFLPPLRSKPIERISRAYLPDLSPVLSHFHK